MILRKAFGNAGPATFLFLLITACGGSNVGRIWDPVQGGGTGTTTETKIAAPVDAAVSLSGQPTADVVAPLGNDWDTSTPAVVIFREAMNGQSIYDETLEINRVYLQEKVSQTKVISNVQILGGGRMVVLLPLALLPDTTYEIVIDAGVKDIDGNVVKGSGIQGEFSTIDSSTLRPEVVAVFPPPGADDYPREGDAYAIFSDRVTNTTVTTASFYLRNETATGTPAVVGTIAFPVAATMGGSDTRVACFSPTDPLPATSEFGIVLKDTIMKDALKLDPGTADPYSDFESMTWRMPSTVGVGALSVTSGFPDAINRNNLATLRVDVSLLSGTLSGDRVDVRIYGGDPRSTSLGDLRYLSANGIATGGVQTMTLDFTGSLGSLTGPNLDDGDVTMAARIVRGSTVGAWRVDTDIEQDLVVPEVTTFGPPHQASQTKAFITDLQNCSLFGQASEELGAAEFTVDTVGGTAELFASDSSGAFFLKPLDLGLLLTSKSTTLNVTDTAGNLNAAATTGTILLQGLLDSTGDLSAGGGTLTVEAWDLATFQPISGATVLVESGVPTKPASGRVSGTTDAGGLATFTGLAAGRYTVTIVATGYHLVSLVNTKASLVSLPLEPTTSGTASLSGTAAFVPTTGAVAWVGCNVLADRSQQGRVATLSSAPNTIPTTSILPNRPVLLTSNVGVFPESANSTTGTFGCPQAIIAGLTTAASPPELAVTPGSTLSPTILSILTTQVAFSASYAKDVSGSGVDTSTLASGYPRVQVNATFKGLPGNVPFGVGFTSGAYTSLTVNGDYAANVISFLSLAPVVYSSLEIADEDGNIARHRAMLSDYTLGTFLGPGLVDFPAVPTLTVTTPATGTPQIQWADQLTPAGALIAMHQVQVTDGNGRKWLLWVTDSDGTGTNTLQLPNVASSAATGLAIPSTWMVFVDDYLSVGIAESFTLEDFYRHHNTFARCKPATIVVN